MTRDWLDMIIALHACGARFLVVGAHAMGLHGVPRGTQDIDFWVEPTPANARLVFAALRAFGAPLAALGIEERDFATTGTVVQIGLPPNRIDFLTDPSGVGPFSAAWERREEHLVQGVVLPVIGRRDLIANKRAAGRRKDLVDLEALGEL